MHRGNQHAFVRNVKRCAIDVDNAKSTQSNRAELSRLIPGEQWSTALTLPEPDCVFSAAGSLVACALS